jgi:citrate lyase gamma subunit
MGHREVVATACPGNYSLSRINEVAATKIAKASDQYGMAVTKTVTPTVTRAEIEKLYLDVLERVADEGGIQTYLKSGMNAAGVRNSLLASTEYANLVERKRVLQAAADQKALAEAETKAAEDRAAQEALKGGYTQADRDRDNETNALVKWIKDWLSKIFK